MHDDDDEVMNMHEQYVVVVRGSLGSNRRWMDVDNANQLTNLVSSLYFLYFICGLRVMLCTFIISKV